MRSHRFGTTAAGVIATAALAAGAGATAAATSAGTATAVPFKASYAGTAVVRVDGSVADISATGTGKGTIIGAGKLTGTGTGDSSQQPCIPFGGTGKLTGVAATIKFLFTVVPTSKGCGDEEGPDVQPQRQSPRRREGVTGKLAKAKGDAQVHGSLQPWPGDPPLQVHRNPWSSGRGPSSPEHKGAP